MAAILNLQIFRKNCKTQKWFFLENRARLSDSDKIVDLQGISAEYPCQFTKKKFVLPKMTTTLNFSQKLQNKKMLIS